MIRALTACLVCLTCIITGCQTTKQTELNDFVSDGCTLVPRQAPEVLNLSEDHCYIHDFRYWRGGTRKERLEADRELRDSVRNSGKPLLAEATFLTVRVAGAPWFPTPWRWGFGWKGYHKPYGELTEEERKMVRAKTAVPQSDLNLEKLRRNARLDRENPADPSAASRSR